MDSNLKITFRGVRGSIPRPASPKAIENKVRQALKLAAAKDLEDDESIDAFIKTLPWHTRGCAGGNTTCIQVEAGDQHFILDGGSGIIPIGQDWMKGDFGKGNGEAHILITHTHIDHIIGFPMFTPFYIPGNRFTFYSPFPDLRERLAAQHDPRFFPVPLDELRACLNFVDLSQTPELEIGDTTIRWHENHHPGRSFSYRVERGGSSFILSTDSEYKDLSPQALAPTIEFFSNADLLIFDSQYGFTESVELKRDWGHGSTFVGVDLALDANIKSLALFHHEPSQEDDFLVAMLAKAQTYLKKMGGEDDLRVLLAQEGITIDLGD